MAHIKRMTDKPRNLPYRAQVKRKGHGTMVQMFQTRAQAERWAHEQEKSILEAGLPLTIEELKKHTVGDIISRYLKEITPTKGCRVSESAVLRKFLSREICRKSLAFVSRQDAHNYVRERRNETWRGKRITPRTVRRELNSIQHVFETAKEEWGLSTVKNPFRGMTIKGSRHHRDRRLEDGEIESLERACLECRGLNRFYVPLALYLAIETGMRLQEIFNLTWQDVYTRKRRIKIRKSKTDHVSDSKGRTIVLTATAGLCLNWLGRCLHLSLGNDGRYQSEDRIFPMTKDAFKQSWSDVLKRAGIEDLTFHDLRREAGSRFDEAELTKAEHDLMMGHAKRDMSSIYIKSDLNRIQKKLDALVGKYRGMHLEYPGSDFCFNSVGGEREALRKPYPIGEL